MTSHRAIEQADADYDARKLDPRGARLSWGRYSVSGTFHFVSSDYQRIRKYSDGGWICGCGLRVFVGVFAT